MPYIHKTTKQYPISEQEIRAANPNVSYTNPFVPPENYIWVFPTARPEYDPISQMVLERHPEQVDKYVWQQTWLVVDLEPEIVAVNKKAAKQQELKNLLSTYKDNQTKLQLNWLAAIVLEGTSEENKKAALRTEIATTKTQYMDDVAAINTKYS